MIYSRFGSAVTEVVSIDEEKGEAVVVFEDSRDGKPEEVSIADLKADGGINEIIAAGENRR